MSIITANVSDLYISSNFTDCLPELSACDISYANRPFQKRVEDWDEFSSARASGIVTRDAV